MQVKHQGKLLLRKADEVGLTVITFPHGELDPELQEVSTAQKFVLKLSFRGHAVQGHSPLALS